MARTSPINPDQLQLFMTGTEWKNKITHSTDGNLAQKMSAALVQSKQPEGATINHREVHGAGVYDSMLKNGYQHEATSPPTIVIEDSMDGKSTRFTQSEGHHRVAAAADIEAKNPGRNIYMPVRWVDTTSSTRRANGGKRPS